MFGGGSSSQHSSSSQHHHSTSSSSHHSFSTSTTSHHFSSTSASSSRYGFEASSFGLGNTGGRTGADLAAIAGPAASNGREYDRYHSQASLGGSQGGLEAMLGLSASDKSEVREALAMAGILDGGNARFQYSSSRAASGLGRDGGRSDYLESANYALGLERAGGRGPGLPCPVTISEVFPLQPLRKHRVHRPIVVRKMHAQRVI